MITATLTADGQTSIASENAEIFAATFSGTWSSGTLVLQCRPKGGEGDWIAITDASWTADGTSLIRVSRYWDLRFSLSGSSSPDLDVTLRSVAH